LDTLPTNNEMIVPALFISATAIAAMVANMSAYSVIVWPRELIRETTSDQEIFFCRSIDFPSQGGRTFWSDLA
jgi:hypothetical protein